MKRIVLLTLLLYAATGFLLNTQVCGEESTAKQVVSYDITTVEIGSSKACGNFQSAEVIETMIPGFTRLADAMATRAKATWGLEPVGYVIDHDGIVVTDRLRPAKYVTKVTAVFDSEVPMGQRIERIDICYQDNATFAFSSFLAADKEAARPLAFVLTQLAYAPKDGLAATEKVFITKKDRGTFEVRLQFPPKPETNALGLR